MLLLETLHKNGVFCTVEAKDGSWCDDGIGEFMSKQSGGNSELQRWRKAIEESLGIKSMTEFDGSTIYKIVVMCSSAEQLEETKEIFGDSYRFIVQEMAGGSFIMIIYVVALVAFFYFFFIRPQRKEQRQKDTMLATLAVGDSVLTTAGFYGVVIDVTDDTVIVEFGNNKNCRIPMQKTAIVQIEKPEDAVQGE